MTLKSVVFLNPKTRDLVSYLKLQNPLDTITDALREAEETDVETEETSITDMNELDLDPDQAEELIQQYLRPSTIFPTFLFRNVKAKRCNFLPSEYRWQHILQGQMYHQELLEEDK